MNAVQVWLPDVQCWDPMALPTTNFKAEKDLVILGLLESVEQGDPKSQRHIASELGVALGLVNACLKRCIKKGLVKVKEAPTRRYAYYLTPQGFAEKSRLTVDYISYSFSFFRTARADCAAIFEDLRARRLLRVVVAGVSDLAEIARICALESGVEIVAIVDGDSKFATFVGLPVVSGFDAVLDGLDAVVVTDLRNTRETFALAVSAVGADRVLAPKLLGIRPQPGAAK